jgi:hypothetical protein
MHNGHILPPDYNRSNREDANILLEVRGEHSLICPTDRGNDPTLDNDGNGLDRGTESSNRDGNGSLHGDQCTLIQNTRREWRKGNGVIKDELV